MKEINGQKPLDWAFDEILKKDAETQKMTPHLNLQLSKIEQIDKKILWFEKKMKELEDEKQKELFRMDELLDLALVSTHELKNGYRVKPDNKRKIEVIDSGAFLKWLKENKEPQEVLGFFKDALKVTALKNFCDKEANEQRTNGTMEPKIDGIDFGEVTYRRLTTEYKKQRKKK